VDAIVDYYMTATPEQIADEWDLIGQQARLRPHERRDVSAVSADKVNVFRRVLDQATPQDRAAVVRRICTDGYPHVLITSWPKSFAPLAVDIMRDGYDIAPGALDILADRAYYGDPWRANLRWARTRVIVASMAAASLERRLVDDAPIANIVRAYADFDAAMIDGRVHRKERQAFEDPEFRAHASFLQGWTTRTDL
jgi:hypothetical protein